MKSEAKDTAQPVSRWAQVQPWLSTVVRVGLAAVFLWSGFEKISDIARSQIAVAGFQILPDWAVSFVGIALPVFELVVAFMLLSGLMTRLAAIGFAAVMLVFIVGIASAWARGLSIDCGCFGGGGYVGGDQTQSYILEILRDVGLFVAAAFLVIWPWSKVSADQALRLEPERRSAKASI